MNKLILTGRVTKDIDLRTGDHGSHVALFTLAVPRNYKNQDGEYLTDFIDCIAFNNKANLLHQYVKKGDLILVEARLENSSYEKNGERKYVKRVIVDNINFLANASKKEDKIVQKSNIEEINQESDPFASFGEQYDIDDSQLPF